MDAVDRLLAELKTKYKPDAEVNSKALPLDAVADSPAHAPAPQSLDHLLKSITVETQRAVRASLTPAPSKPTVRSLDFNPAQELLQVSPKPSTQAQSPQTSTSHSTAAQADKPPVSALEAQRWLNQLKPTTEEGLWFEEFALNYASRLDAAIDYLEALQRAV